MAFLKGNMGKTEQGIKKQRYCIIPRTLIFIFNQEGKVLLLRGAADKRIWANLYNGIGGHIERGEDVLTGALRELREETGIDLPTMDFFGQVVVDVEADMGVGIFIFKGLITDAMIIASSEGELGWFSLDAAEQLALVEDLFTLLPMVARFKPGDAPVFGHYAYDDQDRLIIKF